MYKIILFFSFVLFIQLDVNAQIVTIPDANFKAALLDHGSGIVGAGISTIDTNGDGEIQISEAQAYSGSIDVYNKFISDLTGIQSFISLTTLDCGDNQLNHLDVSNNINLTQLKCSFASLNSLDVSFNVNLIRLVCTNNQLNNLDISNNTNLINLDCTSNTLTTLDVSNNIALIYLNCGRNQLSNLDISNNTAITYLTCNENQLTNLNISNNTNLINLFCYNNQLANLDVSNNTNLSTLWCYENQLTNLDISNNHLSTLKCHNNQLVNLDVSNNTNLSTLWCYENQLTNLDVSNSIYLTDLTCNNNLLSYLDISSNPPYSINTTSNLPFLQICVPNIVAAQSNPFWTKDATTSYIENCHSLLAINGTITTDDNNNCQVDSIEPRRKNILVSFNDGVNTFYAFTNFLGTYQARLDTGMYTVAAIPPNLYFTTCPNNQSIIVDTNYQAQTTDFALQETISCPYLNVDISTPLLRRCFNSTYYVDYCNNGTLAANNAYIDVELDTSLYFNSSSIPLASQIGNLYRFNIGNLPKDSCGRFSIDLTVSCSSQMGQVHCASAHIYPNFLCSWHLPNLEVTDTCLVDTISFTVLNPANAVNLPYLLLEDTVVVDTGSFNLSNGQFASILYPTGGGSSTYQLVLANGDPTHYTASALVGCHTNSASTDLLHLPHLPQDFSDIDCTPNRGSYDPNDKTGYPLGYSNHHYINSNTTIDYRIRFQNTGTDTAIFINILDTISPYLDFSTLTMGTASHTYNVTAMPSTPNGKQVLRFEFNPIYLPDSNVNEPASNGFIQYSIAQLPKLPNGTVINNSASIYFDYNAPVKTNTTLHTVCDNCMPQNITNAGMTTINIDQVLSTIYSIKIAPNPFSNQTRIELEGYTGLGEGLTLEVYDLMGRLQQTIPDHNKAQFLLKRENMPTGIYFFRISEKGKLLQSGRLTVTP